MKSFYSDFVRHCLRFYVRNAKPKFKSEADKQNWYACESALKGFSDSDREMLVAIYAGGDTIPDNVYNMAKEKGLKQDTIWNKLNELERKVAKRRGLM